MGRFDCAHLGGMHILTDAGQVHLCAVHSLCTRSGFLPDLPSCVSCTDNTVRRGRGECAHVGEEIRTEEAELCGMRGLIISIRRCELLDIECTAGRYCRRQTVRSCATCREFEAVETSTES